MSKPEARLWALVDENLGPFGKLERIENAIKVGTADVAYVLSRPKRDAIPASGWVELKVIEAYPVRPTTIVRVSHFEKEQLTFLEDWATAGGRAWVLLRADPWFLLFDVRGARALYEGDVNGANAPAVAKVAGLGRFPTGPILRALTD